MSNFRKFEIRKIYYMTMSRVSAVLKFLLSSTFIHLQNATKEWKILYHWRSTLWAVELGICCDDVYMKISAVPLNILSSV